VTCGSDNVVYVAARDDWNALWIARMQGNSWLGWSYGGGIMGSDPQAAVGGDGNIYSVIRDSTGGIWYRGYTQGSSNGWLSWVFTNGALQDFGAAAMSGGVYISGRTSVNDIWWYRGVSGQWTNVGFRGMAAGPVTATPR
jgi:hypothetical protein